MVDALEGGESGVGRTDCVGVDLLFEVLLGSALVLELATELFPVSLSSHNSHFGKSTSEMKTSLALQFSSCGSLSVEFG